MVENIQYISQENNGLSHLKNIESACKAGAKWIQLRAKNLKSEAWLELALKAREICDEYHSVLIINDSADIALQVAADGVHLGLGDMPVAKARQILGNGKIIGGTANTFEDIQKHVAGGADYVGLGPFRFTTTKEKLSPVLGLEGYQKIMDRCNDEGIHVPIIAIGGIEEADIEGIIATGVHGVAVSGLITNSTDKASLIKNLQEIILSKKEEIC